MILTQELKNKNFIEKANKVHNNKYDYSKVLYIKSKEKIIIICPKHGEWKQTPNNHLTGYGCPKCAREIVKTKLSKSLEDFIKESIQIHGNKYDYSLVNYINEKTKINLICKQHGEFEITPDSHLNQKAGCPICALLNRSLSQRNTTEEFIQKAKKIHGDLYDYNKVNYINAYTKIIITCKKHGDFELTPHAHLSSKSGCPKCCYKNLLLLWNKLKQSFPNEEILYECGNKIIPWIGNQRIDIYFPKYNIAIEYNGKQHYIPVKRFGGELGFDNTIKRDNLKRQKCKLNNCILFEIKYDYSNEDYNKLINNVIKIIKNYEV